MKAPLKQETNFFPSNMGTLWLQSIFEWVFVFREILHPTCVTFETTRSWTTVE